MEQWNIISEIYKLLENKISTVKIKNVDVGIYVADIAQCMFDKSGQRIIVDEKQYEQPAMYEMSIVIKLSSSDQQTLLSAFGQIAVLFKDDPSIDIGSYAWHGCTNSKIYFEPVIRHVDFNKRNFINDVYFYELVYKTEFSLNSQKAYGFKRVEKRDIRGYVKE